MKKVLLMVAAAVILGLVVGLMWGRSLTPPMQIISSEAVCPLALAPSPSASTTQCPTPAISRGVSLMVDYGDGMVRVYPNIQAGKNETMISLLEKQTATAKLEFATKDFGSLGRMVERIGRKANGDDGKYWQFWVNNESINYAASKYLVQPGDVIEWKFLNYK